MEIWKPVVGHPLYEISSTGRVRSYAKAKKGIILKPGKASTGYFTVSLGRGNTRTLHSLVADAFLGPRPEGKEVCHVDGSRTNNEVSNLRYGTRSENCIDASRHGRRKLNLESVEFIRNNGLSAAETAKLIGISKAHVHRVRKTKAWAHV